MEGTSSSASAAAAAVTTASASPDPAASASTPASALQANIAKRGNRSYYYAHTGKYGKGGDPQCKGGKPQKLDTKPAVKTTEPLKKIVISKYMWYDGKKTVTIIVDWPTGFETLDASQIKLDCNQEEEEEKDTSGYLGVQLSVHGASTHVLQVQDLLYPISSASFKIKNDPRHIVVKLKKAEVKSWYSLKKD